MTNRCRQKKDLKKIISALDTSLYEIRRAFAEANELSPAQNCDAVHSKIDALCTANTAHMERSRSIVKCMKAIVSH